MQSFLDAFYGLVDDHLGDARTSRRTSKVQKLSLFRSVEKQIWERIARLSHQGSVIGFSETTITLVDAVELYKLPGNFRKFISFTNYGSTREIIEGRYFSIKHYDRGEGVEILAPQRGMRVQPIPDSEVAGEWVLAYQKGPVEIHQAIAEEIGVKNLKMGTPAENEGFISKLDNYYDGCDFRIYEAGNDAVPQIVDVIASDASEARIHFRHDWVQKPTGTVKYEVRPLQPPDYDHIYSLAVAIRLCSQRTQAKRRALLQQDWKELWQACKEYWMSTATDLPFEASQSRRRRMDPYEDQ